MQVKELLARIGQLAKKVITIVAEIQTLAVECVLHAVAHGDVTPAVQLVEAAGKGIRRASLVAWFERNGPFVWAESKFKLDPTKAKKMRSIEAPKLREQLEALKWEEAKPEPKIVSIFDVQAEFDRFINRVNKMIVEGKMEVRNKELLGIVSRSAEVWHAKRVLGVASETPVMAEHDTEPPSEQPPSEQPPSSQPPSSMLHLMAPQLTN